MSYGGGGLCECCGQRDGHGGRGNSRSGEDFAVMKDRTGGNGGVAVAASTGVAGGGGGGDRGTGAWCCLDVTLKPYNKTGLTIDMSAHCLSITSARQPCSAL